LLAADADYFNAHLPMVALRIPTIALVGNPNTGKTTLFNALAGLNQRVGNYPGVTVETKKGKFSFRDLVFEVIDLPGTYSLAPRSPDEMVAVEVILGRRSGEARPDVVVTIVDASNLDRNLYLMTQVLELGVPVIVALNMMDVAERQGLHIDVPQLSRNLGVAVVPIQANKRKGLNALKEAIAQALTTPTQAAGPPFPEVFEKEVESLTQSTGPAVPLYLVRRLLLDVGGYTERLLAGIDGNGLAMAIQEARERLQRAGCPVPGVEARSRYNWIRAATGNCVSRPAQRPVSWTDRLDKVLTHRIWGTLVFLAVMFLVFESIFFWAKPLMDWIVAGRDLLSATVGELMNPGPLRGLLTDGIIKGAGSVLVFLPQIVILFAFIAVLEDCGYMARAAYLMDRLMSRCGLNGKSFIPLLSSVACAVPGIMAARVIENRRDRLATILVAPLMSCSARLPVYLLLIGAFLSDFSWWVPGLALFAMYALGLTIAPCAAFLLKRTLLRGETPVFVMEMPLYKIPSVRLVCRRCLESGWMFVRRAGTLILATMILVWALLYFPRAGLEGVNFDVDVARLEEAGAAARKERVAIEQDLKDQDRRPDKDASRIADVRDRMRVLNGTLAEIESQIRKTHSAWKGQSYLGRIGKALEPIVEPLGWDWRIGMAALASFPAREVMVGSMGIIFSEGAGEADEETYRDRLGYSLRNVTWDNDPQRRLFTVPVALSVMVFFALCCQCVSTLAVIRRETNSWAWPAFTFAYMTLLAYGGAFIVYQIARAVV
jgi:ferrous iron transport protein B